MVEDHKDLQTRDHRLDQWLSAAVCPVFLDGRQIETANVHFCPNQRHKVNIFRSFIGDIVNHKPRLDPELGLQLTIIFVSMNPLISLLSRLIDKSYGLLNVRKQ